MSNSSRNVDLTVRLRCFVCDVLRHPWAMVRENNEWVCRQCVNYEGNYRLQYTMTNVRVMKNHIREHLSLRITPNTRSGQPNEPAILLTIPTNESMVNAQEMVPNRNQMIVRPTPNPNQQIGQRIPVVNTNRIDVNGSNPTGSSNQMIGNQNIPISLQGQSTSTIDQAKVETGSDTSTSSQTRTGNEDTDIPMPDTSPSFSKQ